MAPALATVRRRIQAQGFCGLDDASYAIFNYPLRLSPAMCMVWAGIGTWLGSAAVLWALAPFAALGAILPGHPFDVLYNHGLRHLFQMPRLPTYPVRRRLACAMATVMLALAACSFQLGLPVLGSVFGWTLAAAALLNVSTGFCVPAFIVRILFGKVRCE
jgi:hypothetical protein